jgi:hypothetical protein
VVSVADPCDRNLGFLDRSRCFSFQVAPQLYSGLVDPVPDQLLRKFCSSGNQTRTSGSVARNSDHWTTDYRLLAGRLRGRSSSTGMVKNFHFSVSGAHTPYEMGIGGSFPGVKAAGARS